MLEGKNISYDAATQRHRSSNLADKRTMYWQRFQKTSEYHTNEREFKLILHSTPLQSLPFTVEIQMPQQVRHLGVKAKDYSRFSLRIDDIRVNKTNLATPGIF